MCLINAIPAKADFKFKKYWKTFFCQFNFVHSVIFGMQYKSGWNYAQKIDEDISINGIHCFDNYQDVMNYKRRWNMPHEVICPVYALGRDIIATGKADAEIAFNVLLVPSTTFKKVFIRKKDWERIIKGESVHD